MFPIIYEFGKVGGTDLFLPTYGLIFASGVLAAWFWFTWRARKLGIAEDKLFNLTFYSLIGGILGAKLALVLLDWRFYFSNPGELLGVLRAAGVLMGGVIVGALVFTLYALRQGLPLHRLGDAAAAPLALAQAVGRLGCFCAGCCWGVVTRADHPLAVVFTDPKANIASEFLHKPLIATQAIQMVHDLALAVLLTWLYRRRLKPDGTVFWIYVLLYSIGRGVIELWRGDAQRGLFLGDHLSTSQLIGIAGVALALFFLWFDRHRARGARPAAKSARGG